MDKIAIGIIGAGQIFEDRHFPGLSKLGGIELVAACNQHRESAEAAARKWNIAHVVDDWRELIRRPDVNVVWIGTPPYKHAEYSIAALREGKHVFCQARMAMNYAEAKAMADEANARPQQIAMLCPAPNPMKHGRYLEMLLRDGSLGAPIHFTLHSLTAQWADVRAPAHWRQKIELCGNNVLSVGIYAEVLESFFGEPESLLASARVFAPVRQGYQVQIPDWVQVTASWSNGLRGSLEWSGVVRHTEGDVLRVYCENGTLIYNFTSGELSLGTMGNPIERVEVPAEFVGGWTVERNFVDAIRSGVLAEPTFNTGLKYMRFLEAVKLSYSSGQRIELSALG